MIRLFISPSVILENCFFWICNHLLLLQNCPHNKRSYMDYSQHKEQILSVGPIRRRGWPTEYILDLCMSACPESVCMCAECVCSLIVEAI